MTDLWIAYDPLGRSVAFTREARTHIEFEHPDLAPYVDAIRIAIEDPDIVTRELDGSVNYYRADVVPRRIAKYLHVLARESSEADLEIRTAWPTGAVDEFEERLW